MSETGLLVYTPTYDDLLRPETVQSIDAQRTNVRFIARIGRYNPYPGRDMRNVVAQYQQARQQMLAGGFDGLLTVEHDMILPDHAIETLWHSPGDVVYGVYMLRHGTMALNAWRYENRKGLGMSLSLYPGELAQMRKRGWGEVCGVGWGCTLMRRQVLERIDFHQNEASDAGDLAFAFDCVRAGVRQVARFDVPCGHVMPDGTVLMPFGRNGGIVNRVLAQANVNINVNGQTQSLIRGRYYSLSPETADELVRAGYVVITNDDKEPDEVTDEKKPEPDAGAPAQPEIAGRETATDPAAAKRSTRKSAS